MHEFTDKDLRIRLLQSSPGVRRQNRQSMLSWGAYSLLKVKGLGGGPASAVRGYVTHMQAISGQTPEEIRDTLGLRQCDLTSGAMIYRLTRVPDEHEFLPRGYSTLIDGVRSRPTGDAPSLYRPGYGAFQIELLVEVEATLVATLKPGERFEPGIHPSLRHLYPDTLKG